MKPLRSLPTSGQRRGPPICRAPPGLPQSSTPPLPFRPQVRSQNYSASALQCPTESAAGAPTLRMKEEGVGGRVVGAPPQA